jgi:hypothetical protein
MSGIRRVKETVPLAECRVRALRFLSQQHRQSLSRASQLAYKIWPDANFTAQGAGASASRILKGLEKEKLVLFTSNEDDWGYRITSAGRVFLNGVLELV